MVQEKLKSKVKKVMNNIDIAYWCYRDNKPYSLMSLLCCKVWQPLDWRTCVSTLALLEQDICVVGPVPFIVEVNTQVFVCTDHPDIQTLNVHRCSVMILPAKVYHRLLCFAGIDVKSVKLTTVDKVSDDLLVFLIVTFRYTPNDSRIIGEHLQVMVACVLSEVWSVQGEKKGSEHSTL